MSRISVSSEVELVDAVRAARESREPFEIVGAGTKRAFGRPTRGANILDMSALSGILNYEHDELVLTARAATPVAEIESVLAEKNQHLGFEPADWGPIFGAPARAATIAGVLSANANGSARIKFGAARDHLLGYRAVNGFGESYKAGGRVVKNVTGFDLSKLMCGAMGTLGPLTELTLRVFPKPQVSRVFAVGGVTVEEGLALLRKIWSSPLEATCLALLSAEATRYFPQIKFAEDKRFVVEDYEEYGPVNACAAIIRLEGTPRALAEKQAFLYSALDGYRPLEIEDGASAVRLINSGTAFVDSLEDVWLLQVPQTGCQGIVERLGSVWVVDWAGGCIWERGTPGYSGEWHRTTTSALGGSAILVRASDETRKRVAPFAPETPAHAALTKAVKAAFDPLGLFNPGRMYEGV